MTAHLICGIDPGLSGALALYNALDEQVITIIDMPTYEIKGKREIDLYALGRFFDMHAESIKLAVIEKPNAMPSIPGKDGKRRQMGAVSAFNFGGNCLIPRAMAAAHFIPMKTPTPGEWKRAMGLTADKDSSRRLASQMLPKFSSMWARAKDEGRSEALLLAVYGSKTP